jgi:NhaA family Na+:H+ antiporter
VTRHPARAAVPSAQLAAEKFFSALERFLHVEAVSGIVLLLAAGSALLWANSPAGHSYHSLWELPLTFSLGPFSISQSLHFIVNDALMSVFFLVVGMEIRREIYLGSLAHLRVAALPLAAALGGIVVPAIIYTTLSANSELRQGWAVPTATDIAFAVGVLALLGKAIPLSVRVLLLALAIIDDIAAVIIIAVFFAQGFDPSGLLLAFTAVLLVFAMQSLGIGNAFAYILPGALLWFGMLKTGVHPSLTGVVLGLLTPTMARRMRRPAVEIANKALLDLHGQIEARPNEPQQLAHPLRTLREAQRELLPPVVRVQMALHPWVAFGVMPLFALANAGVALDEIDLGSSTTQGVAMSVALALVLGKPLGIVLGSWAAVRIGWCQLPDGVTWRGVMLVGILGGIGFTMSIFIATLAFSNAGLLSAAKFGVLLGSLIAAVAGLLFGFYSFTKPGQSKTTVEIHGKLSQEGDAS